MEARLWLVGMMGSGKSTVGRAVAKATGSDFTDTDHMIEDRAGMTVPELFETIGVIAFRDLEKQAIEAASARSGVIATGGGAVLDPDSIRVMTDSGLVVFLSAEPETLAQRVGDTAGRPLLDGQDTVTTLERILAERHPHYRKVADLIVDTDRSRRDVVEEVVQAWSGS